ncbi:MAG: tetratricopeptide repeat protein, partial [Bacteroidales bacterium]|nr:tetratricopeptide repeat protein [Bacteroidales bacterium]
VILCSVQFADAQVKSAATVKKNVEAAEADVANPKKAESVASWIKLGNAYIEAYDSPFGAGWTGASRPELTLVLGNDKPTSSEYVTVNGQGYTKEVFETRNYYYDDYEILQIIEVTKPVYEDALARAMKAFEKAYEVDVKASKTKDINKALETISGKFRDAAFQNYMLGDMAGAAACFENAAAASAQAPLSTVDSLSVYNAGFIASAAGDYQKAKEYFEKAIEIGYYENGDAYAKLGDTYKNLDEVDKAIATLEEGFVKFPESQGILVGLIALYVDNNQDPEKLFGYIDQAKANEPNNASLYYVEGDIYNKLGDKEKALASYAEASKVNPDYEFGYIGAALLYFNEAVDIREAAQEENDDAKYDALVEQFFGDLVLSAEQFEMAYAVTASPEVKGQLAEQLRSIYFQLREQEDKYMAAYEKYSAIVNGQ